MTFKEWWAISGFTAIDETSALYEEVKELTNATWQASAINSRNEALEEAAEVVETGKQDETDKVALMINEVLSATATAIRALIKEK